MPQSLSALLSALPASVAPPAAGIPDIPIEGITKDSRAVRPGWLFVAYKGVENDLHRYIPEAIKRGAAAIVCETPPPGIQAPVIVTPNGREAFAWLSAAWYGFPSRALTLIGITGTDGKTTTSNLLYSVLCGAGMKTGMISTVNAVIGDRVLDTGLHVTTPDADDVQRYLAEMRDAGLTHCVLEVTSHGLAQHRVDGCEFDVAVVTNITHEHLDLHGTREAYRAAKGRLFEMLSWPRTKSAFAPAAILNADDEYSFEFLRGLSPGSRWVYSAAGLAGADLRADQVEHAPDSVRLRLATPRGSIELASHLIGDFNVANILAATGAGLALGLDLEVIGRGIASLSGVPGRMERIQAGQPYLAVVDFAHTPNSLENCLRTLRRITPGRLIVVFGCAGERDAKKRPLMGRIAAEIADVVVITAEDPRRESLEQIMDEIEAGARAAVAQRPAEILRVPDRGEALRAACGLARPGDTVAACGKGHEQSMCFGTEERPWDDRNALRRAIAA